MGDPQNGWFIRSIFKQKLLCPKTQSNSGPFKVPCAFLRFAYRYRICTLLSGFFIWLWNAVSGSPRHHLPQPRWTKTGGPGKKATLKEVNRCCRVTGPDLIRGLDAEDCLINCTSGNQTWQLKIPYTVKRCFTGKTCIINGGFSIAMFDCRRVYSI